MGAEGSLMAQGFGVGASAVGAFYNAQGQKLALNTQAQLSETNAKLAEMSAQSALLTGQREQQSSRLQFARTKSSQRANMAANGVDLGSTTPVAVLTSTDVVGDWRDTAIESSAINRAFGYRAQGVDATNRAIFARASAKSINPWFDAAGSLISGATKVADSWYKFKKEGAFDESRIDKYGPRDDFFARNFGQFNLVSEALY